MVLCSVSVDPRVYSERDGTQSLSCGFHIARSFAFQVKDLVAVDLVELVFGYIGG